MLETLKIALLRVASNIWPLLLCDSLAGAVVVLGTPWFYVLGALYLDSVGVHFPAAAMKSPWVQPDPHTC